MRNKQSFSAAFLALAAAALTASVSLQSYTAQMDSTGYFPDLTHEYLVTQYPDASGVQASCYTIENDNTFILIDGGWAENEAALREIIAEHDNHIDAWIISHPHKDHAGAFNKIYADPQGITIDAVYDNGYDYAFIESAGEPYDDITVMETFYALTNSSNHLIHLQRGDSFSIDGLLFEVYNAFDEIVLTSVGEELDYQNNASLLLKVSSPNSSMLFCSDIKYDMDSVLYEQTKNVLACDYVQTGHHGNWSFSNEFYQASNASVFFLDAPSSLTDNEDFPASELKQWLLGEGKTVFDFSTAPNRVTLK